MADKLAGGVKAGSTSVSLYLELRTASNSVETTGKVYTDVTGSYTRFGAARTAITMATLASASAAFSSGGFILVDDTNTPGLYRFDVPDAAFASGADGVVISVKVTGCFVQHFFFPLETVGAAELAGATGVNVQKWNNSAIASPDTAGYPKVTHKSGTGTGELSLSSGAVIVQSGTGTGQISLSSGLVSLDQTQSLTSNPSANTVGEALFIMDNQVGRINTAQAGASTTITLDASASAVDGRYVGYGIYLYGGTGGGIRGVGQERTIVAYNGTTKVVTVAQAWGTNPDNTSKYMLYVNPWVNVGLWNGTVVATPATAGIPDMNVKNWGNATATGMPMPTYTQPTGFLVATFPGGTIANTTNITAGTITTVTNLTNAPTAGDFTSTMKTSLSAATPAVTVSDKTGFKLASDGLALVTAWTVAITGNITGNLSGSVGSVSGAVGSVTGAVGSVTGSVGSISGVTFPTNFSSLGITAGGKISGVVLVDTVTTNTDMLTASGVWAAGTRVLTAGTNIVLAKGTGVTGFNDISTAQVNTEADTALSDVGLTTTITGRIDAAVSSRLASGSYTAPPSAATIATTVRDVNNLTPATNSLGAAVNAGGGGGGSGATPTEIVTFDSSGLAAPDASLLTMQRLMLNKKAQRQTAGHTYLDVYMEDGTTVAFSIELTTSSPGIPVTATGGATS